MGTYWIAGLVVAAVAAVYVICTWSTWSLRFQMWQIRREEKKRSEHAEVLRRTVMPAQPPVLPPRRVEPPPQVKDATPPPPAKESRALVKVPHPDGLRVNGDWYYQMKRTGQPTPNFVSRDEASAAETRARNLFNQASTARNQGNLDEAESLTRQALDEVNNVLKRDHWYAADILNMLGCILYDRGMTVEAREEWEHAEQVCEEWPDKVTHILPVVQKNIKLAKNRLGF